MERMCIYCGQLADTVDHVPPKAFYTLPLPPNLRTVPSCYQCNNSYSKDEERTALMFGTATDLGINTEFGRKFWEQKGKKALRRHLGLNAALFQTMQITDIKIDKIIIGQTPCFKPEMDRILRVVSKIVKGLFYLENNRNLEYDARVKVIPTSIIKPNEALLLIGQHLSNAPLRDIGNGAMCYKMINVLDESNGSVWLIKFQNKVSLSYLCFTQSVV